MTHKPAIHEGVTWGKNRLQDGKGAKGKGKGEKWSQKNLWSDGNDYLKEGLSEALREHTVIISLPGNDYLKGRFV